VPVDVTVSVQFGGDTVDVTAALNLSTREDHGEDQQREHASRGDKRQYGQSGIHGFLPPPATAEVSVSESLDQVNDLVMSFDDLWRPRLVGADISGRRWRVSEQARTVLERMIRDRRQTPEEFCEEAECYARDRPDVVPISVRHLQRLMAGHRADGRPLGPVRPATRRLLEGMLGAPIHALLASPTIDATLVAADEVELRARLAGARGVDAQAVDLFQQKLDLTRVMDRRLGAPALLGELRHQIEHMDEMLRYSSRVDTRSALARVLVDARTLAGWQSLDQGLTVDAWRHYDGAKAAAREAGSEALLSYATAAQAVVLLDIGETESAVELAKHALRAADGSPALLRSWLNAAYGDACAADGRQTESLRAFDRAARAMPTVVDPTETPYLVFGPIHLERWRGSALARLDHCDAATTLTDALEGLDASFTRAETALRVDLVRVLRAAGARDEMAAHAQRATMLSLQIGSVRQRNRLRFLAG
jgi:tetratricopeptide (TPR) repeat protein